MKVHCKSRNRRCSKCGTRVHDTALVCRRCDHLMDKQNRFSSWRLGVAIGVMVLTDLGTLWFFEDELMEAKQRNRQELHADQRWGALKGTYARGGGAPQWARVVGGDGNRAAVDTASARAAPRDTSR